MEHAAIKTHDAGMSDALRIGSPKTSDLTLSRRDSVLAAPADPARSPRRIAGGFDGLNDDLERRMRDWRNMLRILDQQRPQLEAAEAQHQRAQDALAAAVPVATEAGEALKAMIATTKAGDISEDLAGQFTRNVKALEDLEAAAEGLTLTMLQLRSSWEQYARSIIKAQKMRETAGGDIA